MPQHEPELKISRLADAQAIAKALQPNYPSYKFKPVKGKGQRYWRLAVYDRYQGTYLTNAKPHMMLKFHYQIINNCQKTEYIMHNLDHEEPEQLP